MIGTMPFPQSSLLKGLFEEEIEAARSYDRSLVRLRGTNAATNFALNDYGKEMEEHCQAVWRTAQVKVREGNHACYRRASMVLHEKNPFRAEGETKNELSKSCIDSYCQRKVKEPTESTLGKIGVRLYLITSTAAQPQVADNKLRDHIQTFNCKAPDERQCKHDLCIHEVDHEAENGA
eukprot:540481-Pelagomonas_calceolata.AAC.2